MDPIEAIMDYLLDRDGPALKKVKQEEPEEPGVEMNDPPEKPFAQPFEKMLSYLSLEDLIKARSVSRSWKKKIDSFKVKTLCYSKLPKDFILGKRQLVNGAFAQNFIGSTRFSSFFDTFGQSIISDLKHLRLCDLDLDAENSAVFARTLNLFGQLEELDIIRLRLHASSDVEIQLRLPLLSSIHFEMIKKVKKLTLDAPRLKNVEFNNEKEDRSFSPLELEFVHAESIERLISGDTKQIEVMKLKNLTHFYGGPLVGINSEFLSSLTQLKEVHLADEKNVKKLFEQKEKHGRADLKIFYCGLLLRDVVDLTDALSSLSSFSDSKTFGSLAENLTRLAGDAIPFYNCLRWAAIEPVAIELQDIVLKRLTDQYEIILDKPVKNLQRFLELLKRFEYRISSLELRSDQPRYLFDRLPDHSVIQSLIIKKAPSYFGFLTILRHLVYIYAECTIDAELIRACLAELQFLLRFEFELNHDNCIKKVRIKIDHSRRFKVKVDKERAQFSILDDAMDFILGNGLSCRPEPIS